MPRLRCFTMDGVLVWFYTHDHEPPHFHARKLDAWEIRVFFGASTSTALMYEYVWQQRAMTGREERTLRALVAEHAGDILIEWTDSRVKTEGQ